MRRNLLEQFHELACQRRFRNVETGDIAARPREARDKAAADRIGNNRENDGNCPCLLQYSSNCRCVIRENKVGL